MSVYLGKGRTTGIYTCDLAVVAESEGPVVQYVQ